MKKDYILLLLNIICFFVVLIGSFINNTNRYLNIVVCTIIFASILVQVIAIVRSNRKNS